MKRGWLILFATVCSCGLYAQSENLYLEHDTYVDLEEVTPLEVDNSLFRQYINVESGGYEEVTRYLYTPLSSKRRGVEWWQLSRVDDPSFGAAETLEQPRQGGSARLFGSTSGYRVGASLDWSDVLGRGWGVSVGAYARSGRDMSIEGVFRQELSPRLTLSKDLGMDHYLRVEAEVPYQMRGLRSSATQECYDLTHNNLYNPSWGYYHGEVRNSRVVRNFTPTLNMRYQRPISTSTVASLEVEADGGTRKVSRLGWYDAYNPTPNYYSKLPSYYEGTSAYDEVENAWQQNNTQYTQIAWDQLEAINLSSKDGESHYVVEDRVERLRDADVKLLFETNLGGGLGVEYGAHTYLYNHRNYKQMRDLLGGEYLLDIDQYAGDYVQVGNELQNNLRDPNRRITNGDRFGYDFDHRRRLFEVVAGLRYHSSKVDARAAVEVGDESIYRHGYYEKERFSGVGSYGDSGVISLSTYNLSATVGWVVAPQHYISMSVVTDARAPISRYLFIADQNSNRIIDSPTTEKITSVGVEYRHTTPRVSIVAAGYVVLTADVTQVWQGYDDLSSTYCDVVMSDIATRSIGVELSGEFNISRHLKLTSSLAAGGYTYSSAPLVTLYDDVDMSMVAISRASTLEGYVVGNTPQITATGGLTYFAGGGFILDLDVSYFACRYASASISRRTDRIINSATSVDILESMLAQERLPDVFNTSVSLIKSFALGGTNRISTVLKVDNLFGGRNIISSAREGNRVLSVDADGLTYGYAPQASTYEYSVGRSVYLSVKYTF